jgi:hypothetical protein
MRLSQSWSLTWEWKGGKNTQQYNLSSFSFKNIVIQKYTVVFLYIYGAI